MTDTVGFIRKLPHHLVAPFRSTLEEAVDAEQVLHVVDGSHPSWEEHLTVGEQVLEGLEVERDRVLIVINKADLPGVGSRPLSPKGRPAVVVSAVTGAGCGTLTDTIRTRLLTAPGVAFLRVPLEEAEMVERAVKLPHQLARRFRDRVVEVAMRVDGRLLTDAGLDGFRVPEWESVGTDGGCDAGV